jgi:nitrile hydratase accessory protein
MTVPIDVDGLAAPPRANGELVFAEPWESRAFGMAVTLSEAGVFDWPQFQAALIARISRWEARPGDTPWNYYHHWLGALEDVLAYRGSLDPAEVNGRARLLVQRPRSHDHSH